MKFRIILIVVLMTAIMLNVFAEESNIVKVLMITSMGEIELELNRNLAPITVDNFVGLAMGTREFQDPTTRAMTTGHFYDGLIFHRVIKDFMIQGGCPLGNGTGGPGFRFEDETYERGERLTGLVDSDQVAHEVYSQMIMPYFQSLQVSGGDPNMELYQLVVSCNEAQSYEPLFGKDISFYENITGMGPIYGRGQLKATVDYATIAMANSGPNTNGSQFFIVTNREGTPWLNGNHTVFGRVTRGMDVVHAIEDVEKGANDRPVEEVRIISVRVVN